PFSPIAFSPAFNKALGASLYTSNAVPTPDESFPIVCPFLESEYFKAPPPRFKALATSLKFIPHAYCGVSASLGSVADHTCVPLGIFGIRVGFAGLSEKLPFGSCINSEPAFEPLPSPTTTGPPACTLSVHSSY